jgi:glutamate formiminotransferase
MRLLGFPNVSEGRDAALVRRIRNAFARHGELLDVHSDPVHNRTALTIASETIADALVAGLPAAMEIDMTKHEGAHPCIGALDVCPVVWVAAEGRAPAAEAARRIAEEIAARDVPVFFYGELASTPERRERAFFRRGGFEELRRRMDEGELEADLGPDRVHPTAGATLVTARPPLAAFNVELDTGDVDAAREIAAQLRESGGGLPGVRAIGLPRGAGRSQVSANVHDPVAVPLAMLVERIRELASAYGARPVAAELVGLAPAAALERYPDDVPIEGFDPVRQVIERRV